MWDQAAADAAAELAKAETDLVVVKRRISRFRAAIRIFKDHKARGVPWPCGEGDDSNASRDVQAATPSDSETD
jgi:hypothetical protein